MLDLLILGAFVIYGLSSGLRSRSKASQDLQEYFLAGKTLKGWQAGTSMAATQFAADTPLLVTGLVATAGVFALWRLWIYGLSFLLLAFVFAAAWRRTGVLTDAELAKVRYSGRGVLPLRLIKAVYYGTVINCVVLAIVLVATVRIAEVFLPWHRWIPDTAYQHLSSVIASTGIRLGESLTGLSPQIMNANSLISIVLILAFTATYSITGGLRAVVKTDVVQFAIAMLGTALYAWFVIDTAGGLGALVDRITTLYGAAEANRMMSFSPPEGPGNAVMPFLVLIGLQWIFQMNSDGTGYLAQRAMACQTEKDAQLAVVLFAWLQIFLRSLLWLGIALGLLVIYPFSPADAGAEGFTAAREMLFVKGIEDLLPPGVRGLMLVGLLAALASTVDTHLNWGASYWSNDVYDAVLCRHVLKRVPKSHELVLVARLSNLLVLALAMVVMANLGSIQTAWSISLLFGAGMGSVLILRWLWERINLFSELTAMASSLVIAPLLLYLLGSSPENEWIRLGVMAIVTTSLAIAVTFVTPRTNDETLKTFYFRVRPFGFWQRTARLCGYPSNAPLRSLGRPLAAVTTCSLSLFAMLLGSGRLLFPALDTNSAFSWIYVCAGLALIPVWLSMMGGPKKFAVTGARGEMQKH